MSVPIIPGKVTVPPLPAGYLPRPRLDRLWDGWERKQLVCVTAGAGFGKTSFLAANARSAGGQCGWLCLDESDADLTTFCAHLRGAIPPLGEQRGTTSDPGEPEFAAHALADTIALLREGASGRRLVIDDAHLIRGSAPVVAFLDRLVRYWPQGATLILASREPLGIITMKARCRGATAELTARDLEFRPAEIAALFEQHFPGARLDRELLSAIASATEGWAAGLEIFFQALDGTSPETIRDTLARLTLGGSGWFEYFAEEVVRSLDEHTRDFLYGSAEMPRLDPALCNEVLGISDSREILERLVLRNLFTFRTGDQEPSYRYHHLFRAFLRDGLQRRGSPEWLRRHRRRVARALARAGAWPEAAAVYAEAGDAAATLRLVEKRGERLLATGRYEIVGRALAGIPAAALRRRPRALLVRARLLDFQGYWEEAESCYRRVLRSCPAGAARIDLLSLIAQILLRRGCHAEARALCRRALAERGRRRAHTHMRILLIFGVSSCEMGRIAEGEHQLRRAHTLCRRRGDEVGAARLDLLLAANVHRPRGEFRLAKETALRALVVLRKQRIPRRACIVTGVLADLAAERGEFLEARELAEQARRQAEELGLRAQAAYNRHILGRCDLAAGDFARAREHFTAALQIGDEIRETDLLTFPRLALAELEFTSGDARVAGRILKEVVTVARATHDPLQEAQAAILLGLLARQTSRARSSRWWQRAEKLVRRIGARYELHRLLLFRLDSGDVAPPAIAPTLRELIAGTARDGHSALFLVFERARAARVLPLALQLGIEAGYVRELLVELGPAAADRVTALIADSDERVRLQAVETLAQIGGPQAREALRRVANASDAPGSAARRAAEELRRAPALPLRIAALGSLRLQIGERELSLADWKSSRALRLFQLLLVHRFRWVPRDQVAEALWPETEVQKASNSLWQATHVLRRMLEPELRDGRESRYVRCENDAYRLEPGAGHAYDVREFESLLRKGEALRIRGRGRAAERRFREALELCRGDFLAESPYEEFAAAERERLRDGLLRAVSWLLEFCAEKRRWADAIPLCRRGLEHDPYHEDFHYHLTRAHLHLGHRREALATYHRYEQTMIAEMGLLPAARMKALGEQITPLRARPPHDAGRVGKPGRREHGTR